MVVLRLYRTLCDNRITQLTELLEKLSNASAYVLVLVGRGGLHTTVSLNEYVDLMSCCTYVCTSTVSQLVADLNKQVEASGVEGLLNA